MDQCLVQLHAVSHCFDRESFVLCNISASVSKQRIALVGDNGSGKSTLLRIIAGQLAPTSGSVTLGSKPYLMAQNRDPADSRSVAEFLGVKTYLDAWPRLAQGTFQAEDLDLLDNKWDFIGRLEAVKEIWFPDLEYDRPITEISGGEFANLGLALVQLTKPKIALLDEPSNNLDFVGRKRLGQLLSDDKRTVIVATHDRNLQAYFDQIWELKNGLLTQIEGSFQDYTHHVETRQAEALQQLDQATKEVKRLRRAQKELEQRQASRRRDNQKAAREKRGSKMSMNGLKSKSEGALGNQRAKLVERRRSAAEAQFSAKNQLDRDLSISLTGLLPQELHGARRILRLCSCTGWQTIIGGNERIALVGPNGVGKSRLVASIFDEKLRGSGPAWAEPLTASPDRIGVLTQNSAHLDPSKTLWQELITDLPNFDRQQVFSLIARLSFSSGTADTLVSELSGGEQFRVALAKLILAEPAKQLIVLDEPTNSLDLQSLIEVKNLLQQFFGALLVISHDQAFLDSLDITRWLKLENSGLTD